MPSPPVNPSFEAGVGGLASSWARSVVFSGYMVADFGPGTSSSSKSVEDFDDASWGTEPYAHTVDSGTEATFDVGLTLIPNTVETFGKWSGNAFYTYVVDTGLAASFDSGAHTVEDFDDASWGTEPYATVVTSGTAFAEDFSGTSWNGGDAYATTVPSGTDATFTNGSTNVETFGPIAPDLLFFPVRFDTHFTTPTPHGKSVGYKVTVRSTGILADCFVAFQTYYFVSVTSLTFELSTAPGGTPFDVSQVGSGSHYAHADESAYWTLTG